MDAVISDAENHFHLFSFKLVWSHPQLLFLLLVFSVILHPLTTTWHFKLQLSLIICDSATSLSLSDPLAISDEGSCYSPNLLEPHSQLLCPFQQWSHEREESLKMSTIFLKHIFDHVILCLKNSSDSLAWYLKIFQSQVAAIFPTFSLFSSWSF